MVLNLERIGITQLSEMQRQMQHTFDHSSRDIILLSPTGSGKTLAYLLPVMQSVDVRSDDVQAIVVTPSRELAAQTDSVAKSLKSEVRTLACYGGRPAMDEHRLMQSQHPHIIVATPGRLLDHLQKQNFATDKVHLLILDEFDKCLELGFHDTLRQILPMLPSVKRRILLSATDSEQIPRFVQVNEAERLDYSTPTQNGDQPEEQRSINDKLSTFFVQSPQKDKLQTLFELLCTLGDQQTIVFLNYREAVERTAQFLRQQGVACEQYHGAMEQDRRERALYKFMNGTSNVLVSTDLGSRGIDFPDVDCIVHYHLPLNAEAYTHRNGRTARWDATGRIYFILNEEEVLPEYLDTKQVTEFFIPRRLPPLTQPRMATLYIGKGKKDKISRGDILGLLCKVGGLTKDDIGRIDVRDHCSYAALARTLLYTTLLRLDGQKIKGIKTIFREAK